MPEVVIVAESEMDSDPVPEMDPEAPLDKEAVGDPETVLLPDRVVLGVTLGVEEGVPVPDPDPVGVPDGVEEGVEEGLPLLVWEMVPVMEALAPSESVPVGLKDRVLLAVALEVRGWVSQPPWVCRFEWGMAKYCCSRLPSQWKTRKPP